VLPAGLAILASSLIAAAGAVVLIEMLYHWSLESAQGSGLSLFGIAVDTAKASDWIVGCVLFGIGALSFLLTRPPFAKVWGQVNGEIEQQLARSHG
jgi:branched-chain amino acid transport system permease protein